MRLDKAKFSAWLKAKPPTEIVGKNRDCHGCPIANFYWDVTGGCEIVIFGDTDGRFIDRGYGKRRLPEWADRFAFLVDGDTDGAISAQRAIDVLTEVGNR
jgi:hypothetical protein